MKTMKRFAALLLVVVLMAAMLVVPANAANDKNITVAEAINGVTYDVYKILDLSYNSATASYLYKINSGDSWFGFFKDGAGKNYVSLEEISTGVYSVTWTVGTDDTTKATFAKEAAKNVGSAAKAATYTATADGAFTFAETFAPGYYLITSSAGAAAILDTVTATGTGSAIGVKEKVQLPSIEKTSNKETASIGDIITFTATVTVKTDGVKYVLHDNMGAGFKYIGISSVKYNGTTVSSTDYTVNSTPSDGCDFEISFSDTFCAKMVSGQTLEVVYTATLTDDAIGNTDVNNSNSAWLIHGTNGELETNVSTVSVKTYSLVIEKTDGSTGKDLAGAGFTLYDASNNAIKLFKTAKNVYSVCTLVGCGIHGTDSHVNEVFTDDEGTITINGLGNGNYTLTETTVPAGYVGADSKTVEIKDANKTVSVTNTPGTEFPTTGGIGTTIFYALGGIMVLAAVVFIVTRRRMIEE